MLKESPAVLHFLSERWHIGLPPKGFVKVILTRPGFSLYTVTLNTISTSHRLLSWELCGKGMEVGTAVCARSVIRGLCDC